MARLGLPTVEIVFKELGTSAITRGESGVVALILKKENADTPEVLHILSALDIPEEIDPKHRTLINYALKGSQSGIKKLIVVFAQDTLKGVGALVNTDYNYLVTPYAESSEIDEIISIVSSYRETGKMVKYVTANKRADKPYVINFTTDQIVIGGESVTTLDYTPRIAGLLASLPLSMSATYQPLTEVDSVRSYTKSELDEAIGKGEFVIYNDGRKVKVARGVTSLETTSVATPEAFRKVKILAIADLMKSDIKQTLEDYYIGKYPCDYDHKCLLISAINSYLGSLERDMLLDKGSYCEIDVEAQRLYLEGKGIQTDNMSEDQIKMANTGDNVYLKINAKILDAIEDVAIEITI